MGITGYQGQEEAAYSVRDLAGTGSPVDMQMRGRDYYTSPWAVYTDDWELLFSESMTVSIPEQSDFVLYFDPSDESLNFIDPTEELTAIQLEAIDRAPAWLRAGLYDNFRRISYYLFADSMAMAILDAPDPYVDEVAFCFAHIAPMVLEIYTYRQLMLENAEYIYKADSVLNYVEIIDYGNSGDDDYWSTARYTSIDANGDTVDFEIDRDRYYWEIVHPKLSDEMPTYINPANGQPAAPPVGQFWRTFYWTYADSGYEYLSDMMSEIDFFWSWSTQTETAVQGVNNWVDHVMTWGAGTERPIQPVRIYMVHCGNCGEYQDIRGAAGRTALIPTMCTCNIAEDHVWNEFWDGIDERWVHWDGGMIDNPLVYENGWGKCLSAVYNCRGDGYLFNVTEKYSAGVCTLNVSVYDSLGKPADGTEIRVKCVPLWGGYWITTYALTNSEGRAAILLGDEKNYWLKIGGPLGSYPPGIGQTLVIENGIAGTTYNWEHYFDNYTSTVEVSEAPEYPNPMDMYLMEIDYTVEHEKMFGLFFNFNEFMKKEDTGWVDFFLANSSNYGLYSGFQAAEGFGIADKSQDGFASFQLPTYDAWYGVFSARELSNNRPTVNLSVNVYKNPEAGANLPDIGIPFEYSLGSAYPNPFNHETLIGFSLPQAERVELQVYNSLGQKIGTIAAGRYEAGFHQVKWDGNLKDGSATASGLYFVKLSSDLGELTEKICLIK